MRVKKRTLMFLMVLVVGSITFLYSYLDNTETFDLDPVYSNKQKNKAFQTMRKMKNLEKINQELSALTDYEKSKMGEVDVQHKAPELSPAVIILTYMRSGSSLTGDILQRQEDTFYVFEPIYAIEKAELENKTMTFLDGSVYAPGTYNQTEVYMRDIRGWLTCNMKLITIHSLFNNFLRFGRKTDRILKCLYGESKFLLVCLSELEKECQKSKTKIVKTLRITMTMARELLETIPGSKVIHLTRDPRATLLSKKRMKAECRNEFTGESGCTKLHCDSVVANTKALDNFNTELRQRVNTIRYEELVNNPLQIAEYMYNFVGMEYTDDIRKYVYNVTIGGAVEQCVVCNMKWQKGKKLDTSVTSHISAWKERATVGELVDIQSHCTKVLEYYGYKIYDITD